MIQRIGWQFPDLTPLDSFLRVLVKDRVYLTCVFNVTQLKRRITSALFDVQADAFQNLWKPLNKELNEVVR